MIRKFQKEDIDKMLSLWLQASLQSHNFVVAEYWHNMMPIIKKYYLPNTDSYVFEDKHQIKGFISIIDDKYIGALFVMPKYQKMKIGSKLLNYAKKLYPELSLKVFLKNEAAVRFYKNNDFKIVGEQEDESTGENELLMSWSLGCKSGYQKQHPGDS
jgi:putative acetyltransferase